MAPCITTTFYFIAITITVLSLPIYKPSIILLVEAQQVQVPCIFFFGDSLSDNGNNNGLPTLAKIDYAPYGIDYPGGGTGRFANGPNIPDYLAQLLGFENPIPPFVTAKGSDIVKGVNYASGGAGILDSTGLQFGYLFTMNRQLQNHQIITSRIAMALGGNLSSVRNEYLSKCLYVVNIGSNDYLANYLFPLSLTPSLYTPEKFSQFLIQRISGQLMTLYNQGARKVAVFGIGLLGCLPQTMTMANRTGCVASVNNLVQLFNDKLKPLVDGLNGNLSNAQFTYINVTSISSGDLSVIGIKVVDAPCCSVSSITGLCVRDSVPCSNRSEYAFWDSYHPASGMNSAVAARAYNAALPSDASPVDIRGLVQQYRK